MSKRQCPLGRLNKTHGLHGYCQGCAGAVCSTGSSAYPRSLVRERAELETLAKDKRVRRERAPRAGLAFDCLYLETSALANSWPRPSERLQVVFQLAAQLGVQVFLPACVLLELEERWARETKEAFA